MWPEGHRPLACPLEFLGLEGLWTFLVEDRHTDLGRLVIQVDLVGNIRVGRFDLLSKFFELFDHVGSQAIVRDTRSIGVADWGPMETAYGGFKDKHRAIFNSEGEPSFHGVFPDAGTIQAGDFSGFSLAYPVCHIHKEIRFGNHFEPKRVGRLAGLRKILPKISVWVLANLLRTLKLLGGTAFPLGEGLWPT